MRDRTDYSRAMAASVLLHVGVIVLLMVSRMWEKQLPVGSVVPVNIVANAPTTDLRAAQQAPQEQTAQTEEPTPQAPAAPAAAEPTPAPPVPKPLPTPAKPVPPAPQPKPLPAKPAVDPNAKGQKPPAKAEKSLDLDALAASIARTAKSQGGKTSSAARGANRPETALQPREAAGAGRADMAAAMNGLASELQRRWNPNCEVEGGRDVRVRVTFTLGSGGQLVGAVEAGGQEYSSNSVIKAAAERAIRAVHQAAPFSTLPRDFFGQRVAVNFNAREACS